MFAARVPLYFKNGVGRLTSEIPKQKRISSCKSPQLIAPDRHYLGIGVPRISAEFRRRPKMERDRALGIFLGLRLFCFGGSAGLCCPAFATLNKHHCARAAAVAIAQERACGSRCHDWDLLLASSCGDRKPGKGGEPRP